MENDELDKLLAAHHAARDIHPVIITDAKSGTAEMFIEVGDPGDHSIVPDLDDLEDDYDDLEEDYW